MTSIFEITDGTDDNTISLINEKFGFHIDNWNQGISQFKDGGVYQNSPIAEGRQLVLTNFTNVIETLTLKANETSQDAMINEGQELFRILTLAVEYWTDTSQNRPVYLKVKATSETNARFALIYNYTITELPGTHQQPFLQMGCNALYDEFDLSIERGHWLGVAPGENIAIETSNIHTQNSFGQFLPTLQTDTVETSSHISISSTSFTIGGASGTINNGIRFNNVTVPNGATIIDAFIEVVPIDEANRDLVLLEIKGEDTDNAATFSTEANFRGRTRTDASVIWQPEPWKIFSASSRRNTPSIKTIIQEIINRAGWASNNSLVVFFEDPGISKNIPARRELGNVFLGASFYPRLNVIWSDDTTFGTPSTTENNTFFCNSFSRTQLTHAFTFDASGPTFSGNLIGGGVPHNLLPAAPIVGDILYIGISSVNNRVLSTFSNIIFDIDDVILPLAFQIFEWEYFNPVATLIPGKRDDTGSLAGTIATTTPPFLFTGINSASIGKASDWATTTINGVTSYWIQIEYTVAPTAITQTATQQNRDLFTISQPWIDIDNEEIEGDIESLIRLLIENKSGFNFFFDPSASILEKFKQGKNSGKLVIGSRKIQSTDLFVPYFNCTNFQNGVGVYVERIDEDTVITTSDPSTANTERATFTATDTDNNVRIAWTIDQSVYDDYEGIHRIYLRAKQHTKAGSSFAKVNLSLRTGNGTVSQIGDSVSFATINDWQLLNLGEFKIPNMSRLNLTENVNNVILELFIEAGTIGDVIYCYDIAIIPTHEWAIEVTDTVNNFFSRNTSDSFLDIDSTSKPSVDVSCQVKQGVDNNIRSSWQVIGGKVQLPPRENVRLYFLSARKGTVEGTDDGGAGLRTTMTDTSQDFINQGVKVGQLIYSPNDQSQGLITSVTATTIVADLAGGNNNQWNTNYPYQIDTDEWVSEPWVLHNIRVFKNDRYLSARGSQ